MKKKFKLLLVFSIVFLTFCLSISFNSVYAKEKYLYLGGQTCGFNLKTRGATVVGITDVLTDDGVVSPSKCAGLEIGDVILSMNGKDINTASDLTHILSNYKGGLVITEILRNNNFKLCDIFPEKDVNGIYRIGVLLREDLQGLGTVTYVDEEGNFGALGHPVASQSGKSYDIVSGEVYDCSIIGLNKASRGKAGELKGMFIGDKSIGEITANKTVGLFGKFNNFNSLDYIKIEVGKASIGKAQ
ncbi:MAG: PDZ domain-containing protein, partial [Clostridia bacterium]|nr:PDZ domain-containing protein [Clostridia bacterium]